MDDDPQHPEIAVVMGGLGFVEVDMLAVVVEVLCEQTSANVPVESGSKRGFKLLEISHSSRGLNFLMAGLFPHRGHGGHANAHASGHGILWMLLSVPAPT